MHKVDFGEWLESKRKSLYLSQRQFAKQAHLNHATVHKLESGKMLPSDHHVKAVAKALGEDEIGVLQMFGLLPNDPASKARSLHERIDKLSVSDIEELESFLDYMEARKKRIVDKPKVIINREAAPFTEAAL